MTADLCARGDARRLRIVTDTLYISQKEIEEVEENKESFKVEDLGIPRIFPLRTFGTPVEIIKLIGGKDQFLAALQELEAALYAVA